MKDDGVPAVQFKLLCTTLNWAWKKGIFVWHQDKDEKYLLPDGKPTPCKPNPMRNGPEKSKTYPDSLNIGNKLCEKVITRRVRNTHEPLIEY